MAFKEKFFKRLLDTDFNKWKLKRVFHTVINKYSDRTQLLLPKYSCSVFNQKRIPEYLVDSVLDMTIDHHFLASLVSEGLRMRLESHIQLNHNENAILMANGTTDPTRATPVLTHGNEEMSFLKEP